MGRWIGTYIHTYIVRNLLSGIDSSSTEGEKSNNCSQQAGDPGEPMVQFWSKTQSMGGSKANGIISSLSPSIKAEEGWCPSLGQSCRERKNSLTQPFILLNQLDKASHMGEDNLLSQSTDFNVNSTKRQPRSHTYTRIMLKRISGHPMAQSSWHIKSANRTIQPVFHDLHLKQKIRVVISCLEVSFVLHQRTGRSIYEDHEEFQYMRTYGRKIKTITIY